MLAKIWSAAVRGIEGCPILVELDLANGLPRYTTVGLPDSEVRESQERVASALRNSGFEFPPRRVTVNLAPAQWRKRGTQFDLPVALGLLVASGQMPEGDWMSRYCFLGELALDGAVKPVPGVLSMVASAQGQGIGGVVLARPNAAEAAVVGMASFGVSSLREAVAFVTGHLALNEEPAPTCAEIYPSEDLADVRGQNLAKRALEIAAAGRHHLLMIGPPGTGKSMLARRLPGILPAMGREETLEVIRILSVSGLLPSGEWKAARPFRAPHHTIPPAALVGGGSPSRPGEVTLAHQGVLFLDELPEFKRESLEALRVPLESGSSAVSRLGQGVEYPAQFLLAAAMNPCPCGFLGHPTKHCSCTPPQVLRYRSRISGPLMDRLDLTVEMSPLSFEEWNPESRLPEESSATVRKRIFRARERQARRLGGNRTNAGMCRDELRRYCALNRQAKMLLESAAKQWSLSARSLDRILRVARTIADLEGTDELSSGHVAEALALSGRERGDR